MALFSAFRGDIEVVLDLAEATFERHVTVVGAPPERPIEGEDAPNA